MCRLGGGLLAPTEAFRLLALTERGLRARALSWTLMSAAPLRRSRVYPTGQRARAPQLKVEMRRNGVLLG
jgi:hypothetical protein